MLRESSESTVSDVKSKKRIHFKRQEREVEIEYLKVILNLRELNKYKMESISTDVSNKEDDDSEKDIIWDDLVCLYYGSITEVNIHIFKEI